MDAVVIIGEEIFDNWTQRRAFMSEFRLEMFVLQMSSSTAGKPRAKIRIDECRWRPKLSSEQQRSFSLGKGQT